ncbi:MAG: hypothetical protein KBT01_02475 [Clostridiales bacterium]|nr:hypothetical protein [Candidatus Blautia equi]
MLQKRYDLLYKGTTILLLAFILFLNVCNLLHRDRTYSENENRMLAQKPHYSYENLVSGKYMTESENYITDQFILRDQWIRIKFLTDKLLGKKESNGVYIGKKGYLFEVPEKPVDAYVDKNLTAIKAFAKNNPDLNMVMTLVPNASTVCTQYLPNHAPVRNQAQDILRVQTSLKDSLEFVDITDALKEHKDEPIYYKTDHHWTSLGAKYAYLKLQKYIGAGAAGEEFDVYPVTAGFVGTLASKVGYHAQKDFIELYVSRNGNMDYLVDYVGEKKNASIYSSEALEQKDKYEVFFGGNHARIDIQTQNKGGNLLILKDSYANCFVQFLLPYYRSITIVDPRYYMDNLNQLIASNGITDVLFLYNVNTFMKDNSLADVLEG